MAANREFSWKSGSGAHWGERKKLVPSKEWTKSCHQKRSRWKSLLRRIWWSSLLQAAERSIICGRTTLQAWCRWPISDASSFGIQCFFHGQSFSRLVMWSNLSLGNLAWRASGSSSMPWTVRVVDRPSSLSGWIRILHCPKKDGYRSPDWCHIKVSWEGPQCESHLIVILDETNTVVVSEDPFK